MGSHEIRDGCYIFGAGAHGRVIADILQSQNQQVTGFLDDDQNFHGKTVAGHLVIGGCELVLHNEIELQVKIIVAIGNAPIRLMFSHKFRDCGLSLINALHRNASVSPTTILGDGNCVCAGAVLNPDTRIGDAVIVNTGATVDHDCLVEDGAHLSPGVHLAGRVQVGRLSFLGTGVSVAPRVRIGANSIIGAGAVVISNIPEGVLAVGVPARIVRELVDPVDWSRLL
jgi:acetyltransferase EpsM